MKQDKRKEETIKIRIYFSITEILFYIMIIILFVSLIRIMSSFYFNTIFYCNKTMCKKLYVFYNVILSMTIFDIVTFLYNFYIFHH